MGECEWLAGSWNHGWRGATGRKSSPAGPKIIARRFGQQALNRRAIFGRPCGTLPRLAGGSGHSGMVSHEAALFACSGTRIGDFAQKTPSDDEHSSSDGSLSSSDDEYSPSDGSLSWSDGEFCPSDDALRRSEDELFASLRRPMGPAWGASAGCSPGHRRPGAIKVTVSEACVAAPPRIA